MIGSSRGARDGARGEARRGGRRAARRAAAAIAAIAGVAAFALGVEIALGQFRDRDRERERERDRDRGLDLEVDRGGVPLWEVDPAFRHDVFTFVRIEYSSGGGRWGGRGRRWRGAWRTDYPDSDLNFSFRLQQLTSLKVDPEGAILRLTDEELFDHPFIYIIEPGDLVFEDAEVSALRRYLLNGGFLMVDDFWGDDEWENFEEQIGRVFPDREIVDVPLDHEIFHCVYDLKEKPQVPSINVAQWGRSSGITWEGGEDTRETHYRAIFDEKGHMMAFICHNTDLGDGWEREGVDEWYFREFSEKKAYPLGINIVVYAMTH